MPAGDGNERTFGKLTEHESDHVSAGHVGGQEEAQSDVQVIIVDEGDGQGRDQLKDSGRNEHFPAAVPEA